MTKIILEWVDYKLYNNSATIMIKYIYPIYNMIVIKVNT